MIIENKKIFTWSLTTCSLSHLLLGKFNLLSIKLNQVANFFLKIFQY